MVFFNVDPEGDLRPADAFRLAREIRLNWKQPETGGIQNESNRI